MTVDEKPGSVSDGAKSGRAGRISASIGGTDTGREGNLVRLAVATNRDDLLPAAISEALERAPEYLYRG